MPSPPKKTQKEKQSRRAGVVQMIMNPGVLQEQLNGCPVWPTAIAGSVAVWNTCGTLREAVQRFRHPRKVNKTIPLVLFLLFCLSTVLSTTTAWILLKYA